ncbi:hypothetical protein A0H81_14977 [Grifola frondosa]|uniref:Uncharacterized protein n=1 Tax=Grifola frondosa TaxID=5627 RepID=A0A1C7LQG4_GRIFR|nr:hypothetical protein A0H81_14977 [Grifola frondosa]
MVGCRGGKLFQLHDFSLTSVETHAIRLGVSGAIYCLAYDTTTKCLAIGMGSEVHITHERNPNEYTGDIKIPTPPSLAYTEPDTDGRLRAVTLQFYNEGTSLIVSYLAHGIVCWDIGTRTQLWSIIPPSGTPNIGSSALSPDRSSIIIHNVQEGLHLYSIGYLKNQSPILRNYKFEAAPRKKYRLQVAYLHQGQAVVCGTTTGNVCIWETASGDIFQLLPHNGLPTRQFVLYRQLRLLEGNKEAMSKYGAPKFVSSFLIYGNVVLEALHAVVSQRSSKIRQGTIVLSIFIVFITILWTLYSSGIVPWSTMARALHVLCCLGITLIILGRGLFGAAV